MAKLSFAVITVSDSCSEGTATDTSGPHLRELIKTAYVNIGTIEEIIIPDDIDRIQCTITYCTDVLNINVVFTTGGTGFSNRDVTPEATRKVIEKEAPQLTLAMALCSLTKTQFAALSRAICGIRKNSLIINLPGSKKAVEECFGSIRYVIPHAVQLITGANVDVKKTHNLIQKKDVDDVVAVDNSESRFNASCDSPLHRCSTKTGHHGNDRYSPYPMIEVHDALQIILAELNERIEFSVHLSTINIPPFRASIKDGYAVKSTGSAGLKSVVGFVSAGDPVLDIELKDDECIKINTGAPVPTHADSIIQIEDTTNHAKEYRWKEPESKILESVETAVVMNVKPVKNCDIRAIGSDLAIGDCLFESKNYPGDVPFRSLNASVGKIESTPNAAVSICVISTGDELMKPGTMLKPGKIYDSNSTMLTASLNDHGYQNITAMIIKDTFDAFRSAIAKNIRHKFIICSGGVSMGDKDYLKEVLSALNFKIHFGRVNMKPGKPMTFATNENGCFVFGLPGNPVSAFVCFHLFVLPTIRKYCGYGNDQLSLPMLQVELLNESMDLDPRPEYARAKIISKEGKLYARVVANQISSRLKSIEQADVLLLLPKRTENAPQVLKGAVLNAYVVKRFFISEYQ